MILHNTLIWFGLICPCGFYWGFTCDEKLARSFSVHYSKSIGFNIVNSCFFISNFCSIPDVVRHCFFCAALCRVIWLMSRNQNNYLNSRFMVCNNGQSNVKFPNIRWQILYAKQSIELSTVNKIILFLFYIGFQMENWMRKIE